MKFTFTDEAPRFYITPALISGIESAELDLRKYLVLEDHDGDERVFEIRYEYHCSPFKDAIVIDEILAVGYEVGFYLFNIATNQNLLALKVDGYFGYLYFDDNLFYVADMSGLYCINKTGLVLWHNTSLAVDGVIINTFTDENIYGSAEMDPPGGWKDFILDRKTGALLSFED